MLSGIAEKAKGMMVSLKAVVEGHRGSDIYMYMYMCNPPPSLLPSPLPLPSLLPPSLPPSVPPFLPLTIYTYVYLQSWEEHLLTLVCMSPSRVPAWPSWTLEMHTSQCHASLNVHTVPIHHKYVFVSQSNGRGRREACL